MTEKKPDGPAKLTKEQVCEIRKRYADGCESTGAIGKDFGILGPTVRAIAIGRSWAWFEPENIPGCRGRDVRIQRMSREGEKHNRAKLTEAQVVEIRARRKGGASLRWMAKEYGVSEGQLSLICSGKAWPHVPMP